VKNLIMAFVAFSVSVAGPDEFFDSPATTDGAIRWVACTDRYVQTREAPEAMASAFLKKSEVAGRPGYIPILRIIAEPSFMGQYTPPPEGTWVLTLYRKDQSEMVVELLIAPFERQDAPPINSSLGETLAKDLTSRPKDDKTDGWFTARLDAGRTYTMIGGARLVGSQCVVGLGDLFGDDLATSRRGKIIVALRKYAAGEMERNVAEAALKDLLPKE
jgi:hypothetical protein